ncbi:MAG: hypothetical protein JWM37_478 [Candidatus Saccharibacteria bacterium]|nr:hypothetical protein [Candidatus Saccharibacteria bacterium]
MLPDEPTNEERLEEVDNDGGTTPFRPPEDVTEPDDDTHPNTDSEIQPEEVYHDGLSIEEPNKANAVLDYDPAKDVRQDDIEQ